MIDYELIANQNGYTNLRWIDGKLCGILKFLYTYGVCVDIGEHSYKMRFCFETKLQAVGFLEIWDGETLPVIGRDGCTAIK